MRARKAIVSTLAGMLLAVAVPATGSAYNVGDGGGMPNPGEICDWYLEGMLIPVEGGWLECVDNDWVFHPSGCADYCPIG